LRWRASFNGEAVVFELFGSKTKRNVFKLERVMIMMETAAKAGDLPALHRLTREQTDLLGWLHTDGDWPEDRIDQFLRERGLVRSLHDPALRDLMAARLRQAETAGGWNQKTRIRTDDHEPPRP
jgi:hypothetical protein